MAPNTINGNRFEPSEDDIKALLKGLRVFRYVLVQAIEPPGMYSSVLHNQGTFRNSTLSCVGKYCRPFSKDGAMLRAIQGNRVEAKESLDEVTYLFRYPTGNFARYRALVY